MNLVGNHVVKLKHIHHTDSYALFEWLTSETIIKRNATIASIASFFELVRDSLIGYRVEGWRRDMIAKCTCSHTEVSFIKLTEVHTRRHTHRVENYVNWRTIFHKWHILNWENTCNYTLVTVTTRKFITNANLAKLCDVNLNLHEDARFEVVTLLTGENLNTNNFTSVGAVHTNGSIANVFGFFAEDSAKKALFGTELLFALWCNFTNENIAIMNLRTDSYDTVFTKVAES